MPFAFLLVIALWIIERKRAEDFKTSAQDFGAGLVLALPFLCRSIGLVVAVSGVVLVWRAGRRVHFISTSV